MQRETKGNFLFLPVLAEEGNTVVTTVNLSEYIVFDLKRGSVALGGTSNYDAHDIEGAIGAKFANGTADVRIKGIEGEGRVLINADLELAVIGNMVELAFKGIAGGFATRYPSP